MSHVRPASSDQAAALGRELTFAYQRFVAWLSSGTGMSIAFVAKSTATSVVMSATE
jgi:hypothetical protein